MMAALTRALDGGYSLLDGAFPARTSIDARIWAWYNVLWRDAIGEQ